MMSLTFLSIKHLFKIILLKLKIKSPIGDVTFSLTVIVLVTVIVTVTVNRENHDFDF
jgi:hypothetical protein